MAVVTKKCYYSKTPNFIQFILFKFYSSQQTPSGDQKVFDHQQRSLSPPRSSNSSGYGTGSSRKSSTVMNQFNQKVNLLPTVVHPKTEIIRYGFS